MEIAGQQIFQFLSHYGYWLMLPLMIVEGPIVTIVSGMLARLGAFNIFIVFGFSVVGDMIGDVIIYWLGYRFGMAFVRRVGKYMGITENLVLKIEKYFKKHGGKTIFTVKATTGLCFATFATAGIIKMDFKKFLKYSFLGGLAWSGFLVILGYFYGYMWFELRQYIQWVGWLIFFVAIATVIFVTVMKKIKSKKMLENGTDIV